MCFSACSPLSWKRYPRYRKCPFFVTLMSLLLVAACACHARSLLEAGTYIVAACSISLVSERGVEAGLHRLRGVHRLDIEEREREKSVTECLQSSSLVR